MCHNCAYNFDNNGVFCVFFLLAVCQANGTFNCSKNIKSMCENVHSSSLRMTSDVEAVARQQEES